MAYSVDAIPDNCYEGTTCLINKLDIRDEDKLNFVESQITIHKTAELASIKNFGQLDFSHYKAIHKYLFNELYVWAGEIRTVNMSKKGTNFVDANEIESVADACFKRLKDKNYFQNQPFNDFIDDIVDFYCTTNMLHPFREGNGRTQRVFITQLIQFNGYSINFDRIDTDELMMATIQAANGVTDNLKRFFESAITKE